MDRKPACWTIVLALASAIAAAPAAATESPAGNVQQSDASSAAHGWTTNVAPDEPPPPRQPGQPAALTAQQQELLQKISAYFNANRYLEGRFTQINPDKEQVKGKFYVRRPGLLRFDYAPPSRLRIVADGEYLSIEDHDLKTVDQYPLDKTPFRILLSEKVDLAKDATILDFSQSDSVVSVTLEDKADGSRGRLQLFFSLPDIELKEWVITDPQGLDTRIQLEDVVAGNEIRKDFFRSTALELQGLTGQ